MDESIIHGNILMQNAPVNVNDPFFVFKGKGINNVLSFSMNEDMISKHILLVGGTGSGKTNVFNQIVSQIKRKMTDNDVMIIFDTKGDYFKLFFDEKKDIVLGNSEQYEASKICWNIFKEIVCDGLQEDEINANIQEIAWSLFSESIETNKSQPFFPNAARDLFSAILTYIVRIGKTNLEFKKSYFNNSALRKYFDLIDAKTLSNMLKDETDLSSVLSYIGDGTTGQALGVMAEMQSIIRKIFVGNYAKDGRFSIRDFVRQKKQKTLFIEYDLSYGKSLIPIYQLLIDLALKEALGRSKSDGNVYVICDEFKLLPHLSHIDDAVNFGRSLGVKIFAGIQSIEQLNENYGEARAKNITAGFSSIFSFKANDISTREFTSGLYGKNLLIEEYKTFNNPLNQEMRNGNVVEDWDVSNLRIGEAIIGLPFEKPFKFKFELFKKESY